MWRSIVASVGAAVSAVGSAVNSALGAISGAVLSVATTLAPKPPPSTSTSIEPTWYDGGAAVCPGGSNWRGPFPTIDDAREYQYDIPVPSYIYRYVDGWWLYVPPTR